MIIETHIDCSLTDVEVILRYPEENSYTKKIRDILETVDGVLIGKKENERVLVPLIDIIYIDSVDRRTFLYTDRDVYEIDKKIYELETLLSGTTFFRVSKTTLLNLLMVKSIRSEIGGRLLVTVNSGDRILVSRQYATSIKNALEVK